MLPSDGSVMRTCAKVGLKDCVEMEGKTYCYCKNQLCNTPDGPLASFGGNAHHRKDYSDEEGSGYGDDDNDDDEDYYYEEGITEMPPSVKMDGDIEVKDAEKPRKVGGIPYCKMYRHCTILSRHSYRTWPRQFLME